MRIIIAFVFTIPCLAHAATWKVEVKDGQTSEVKNYSFVEHKSHKLELPKFNYQGCLLNITEPVKIETSPEPVVLQKAEIQCFTPTGAVYVKKVCPNLPDQLSKVMSTAVEVIEDGAKFVDKKNKSKPGKFGSYLLTLSCE
jgi:hypothetical protein